MIEYRQLQVPLRGVHFITMSMDRKDNEILIFVIQIK